MPEAEPLSPRKTAVVLLIVGGCFAVLWPRLLQPALLGQTQNPDPLAPNKADRAQGCCDVIFEKDVNAIKIMIELCGNILERKSGPLDARTAAAFRAGKLPPDIVRTCRLEVNSTCGVDISTFLQQNVKLGKTYKQILDEVRSYNSSACLKMHYGVPTWALGSGHPVLSGALHDIDSIRQERPPHSRGPGPHPAMLERGRAIPAAERPPARAPDVVRRAEGRVRSPLSVYYQEAEPPPVPGMRPPLGGAGGALPPPKSSVGFVMPIYTLCIVVFFVYTLCKILFKRTDASGGNYESVTPDPLFRERVFENRRLSRASPDTKLGHKERDTIVSAISGLVAEVQQQMEASYAHSRKANGAQVTQPENNVPYTNGTFHKVRDASPIRNIAKEFKEVSNIPDYTEQTKVLETLDKSTEKEKELSQLQNAIVEYEENLPQKNNANVEYEEKLPLVENDMVQYEENFLKNENFIDKYEEVNPEIKAITPERSIKTPEVENVREYEQTYIENIRDKQSTPELIEDILKNETLDIEMAPKKEEREEDIHEALSEEEIEYEVEEDEEDPPLVRQLRASVENDKATVKVMGMETTAHCEGGEAWGDRPLSPPAAPRPAPSSPARPHEASEVSSIFLSGDIPQQSRLLVADSHTDTKPTGKDSPVILSGKMTLSLINDGDSKSTPERDLESPVTQDDEDFTTASAYTHPKQNSQQQEAELSEEEIEEEVEDIEEEEVEVEEIEVEDEEEEEKVPQAKSVHNSQN